MLIRSMMNKSICGLCLFAASAVHAANESDMRNKVYCEIITNKDRSFTTYAVYTTWGLNDCPQSIWQNITPSSVKKQTKSWFVHLNGPRHWIFDGFQNSKLISKKIRNINGLNLREAGEIHLSVWRFLKGLPSYEKQIIHRTTNWIYDANKPVYELIDPNGQVYVMQSYSTQKKPQTSASLAGLGDVLKLPSGWKFKTGLLKKSEKIPTPGNQATVIQDDFLNTYQAVAHDLLQD